MPQPSTRLTPTLLCCAGLLLALLAAVSWLTGGFQRWTFEERRRQQASDAQLQAVPVAVRSSEGQPFTLFAPASTPASGQIYLVDFIYTRCVSVCQVLGSEYTQMQEALRQAGPSRLRLLSISFDVQRDQQRDLAAYAQLHRADPALWIIAAPLDAGAAADLLQRLGVVAIPDGLGGFVHNGAIHLIDAQGRVLEIFDYTRWPQALAAAQKLAAPS